MPSDTLTPAAPGAQLVLRSTADRAMRRLLGLDPIGPRISRDTGRDAFPVAIAVSAVRCLLTYIVFPVLGPVLNLSGGIGPIVGLFLGIVSLVALFLAMRRFFGSDHRMRWRYAGLAGGVAVLVLVQAVFDVAALAN